MNEIYFDNSATTKISEKALAAVMEGYEQFGNPSSLHTRGAAAQKRLTEASKSILSHLTAKRGAGDLIFTSGGTEANNLALLGAFHSKVRRPDSAVMITDSEHASIEMPARELERAGYRVLRVPTKNGVLDTDFIFEHVSEKVVLASFMLVNNETGALYDVKRAFEILREKNPSVITHTDAVQAFGKVPFDAISLGADLVSVSSHKIHGPMGVGALFVRSEIQKAKQLVPIVYGGSQQKGYRSGTENLPAILGFAAAAEDTFSNLAEKAEKMRSVREYLIEKLSDMEVSLNLPPVSAPHVLSVTLPSIKSEVMLHFLSSKGVLVSSGSACSSNHPGTSVPLVAFGLSPNQADSTVRLSFSAQNTKEEADVFIEALSEGLKNLVRIRRR